MDRIDLGALFFHFLALWFVAIGGPSAILPDIHRYVVEAHQLLSNREFAEIYTLAQVAPGPNVMYVTLIGWQLAGWAGAAATTIPLLVPATTVTLLVGRFSVTVFSTSENPSRPRKKLTGGQRTVSGLRATNRPNS